jgi:hypothetical protein
MGTDCRTVESSVADTSSSSSSGGSEACIPWRTMLADCRSSSSSHLSALRLEAKWRLNSATLLPAACGTGAAPPGRFRLTSGESTEGVACADVGSEVLIGEPAFDESTYAADLSLPGTTAHSTKLRTQQMAVTAPSCCRCLSPPAPPAASCTGLCSLTAPRRRVPEPPDRRRAVTEQRLFAADIAQMNFQASRLCRLNVAFYSIGENGCICTAYSLMCSNKDGQV